jgi:hypothetical protein
MQNCMMNATQAENRPPGFVTAQRQTFPNETVSFVFRGGSVVGSVKLGRAWGHFARVVFWETYFSSMVDPVG